MDHPSPDDCRLQLAALLRLRKEKLMRQWALRVLEDPGVPEAHRLSEPELRDHLPLLLDAVCHEIEAPGAEEAAGRAIGSGAIAREHARNRAANGYSLTEALRELSHFRAAILALCTAEGVVLDDGAAALLHAAIDESMVTGGDEMERASGDALRQEAAFRELFIGILGHDLRNPLQVVKLGTSAVLDLGVSSQQAQVLGRVVASAERMQRMIEELLDLTRARLGGGIPVALAPCDLGNVVGQVLHELEIAHPHRSFLRTVSGDLGGEWDPDRIAQMLTNLVVNAVNYSPPETAVRVEVDGTGAQVVLSVTNQGPVIAPEVVGNLFDPFVRGSANDRLSGDPGTGLGLGLFIVKQIVDGHGGSLQVTSTVAEGTTFTVHLPR